MGQRWRPGWRPTALPRRLCPLGRHRLALIAAGDGSLGFGAPFYAPPTTFPTAQTDVWVKKDRSGCGRPPGIGENAVCTTRRRLHRVPGRRRHRRTAARRRWRRLGAGRGRQRHVRTGRSDYEATTSSTGHVHAAHDAHGARPRRPRVASSAAVALAVPARRSLLGVTCEVDGRPPRWATPVPKKATRGEGVF